MDQTAPVSPAPTPAVVVAKPNYVKVALAWTISLLFLFIMIYVISRAWKKGQVAA